MRLVLAAILASLAVAGCDQGNAGHPYTLYRNSTVDRTMRIHWATFDANESSPIYNMSNCLMAAKLLNANVDALAEGNGGARDPMIGFWCEPGEFKEKGKVPFSFPGEYPTSS